MAAFRYYVGPYEELHLADGNTYRLHYISGGDGLAAIHVVHVPATGATVAETFFVYKDHLGSIIALTDESGDVVHRQSFDAWGKRRNPDNWTYDFAGFSQPTLSDPSMPDPAVWLNRGYTGHEHLDEFVLINMNNRMYDPEVGRMLAVDNFVQNPFSTQAYNRYSYAASNPLKYVDPTGEYFVIDDVIAAAVGGIVNLVVNAVQGNLSGHGVGEGIGRGFAAFFAGAVGGIGAIYPEFGGWAWGGAVVGATNSWLSGANTVGDIALGAAVGAASGFAGGAAGSAASSAVASSLVGSGIGPVVSGTVSGIAGGVAGGAAGGFVGGFIMGGADLEAGLKGAASGMATGAAIGGASGALGGYIYARQNNLDPWTGKSLQPQQPVQPSDLTNITEKTTLQRNGVEFEIKPRPNPGGDGARSYHVSEVINGDRVSITHIVITPNGVIIHQHQYFIGQSGARYYSPNDLGQFPTINFPKN